MKSVLAIALALAFGVSTGAQQGNETGGGNQESEAGNQASPASKDKAGQEKKKAKKHEKGSSDLEFEVVKASNGKPVHYAAVILHPVDSHGHQGKSGVELKTDAEGHTLYSGVPYGRLRVQVIAPRFRTFGQDYAIDQPTQKIVIKLERPAAQYSIYDNEKPDKKQ